MNKSDKSALFRILVPLLSIICFVIVAEVIARALDLDPFFQNRFFVLNRAIDYPDVFKRDHDLFWRLRQSQTVTSKFFIGRTYSINKHGLHGPEIHDPKTTPRLLTLGNSCTFGWGVNDDQGYVRQLDMMLDHKWEVINGAIPGYTSFQGLKHYDLYLRSLKSDVVLILFAFNDHWAAASQIADKDQQLPPQMLLDLQNALSRLHSYRLLKKLLLSTIEEHPDSLFDRANIVYRVSPDDFESNLSEMIELIQQDNALPVLLTSPIPSLADYYPEGHKSGLHSFHERYNEIIRSLASQSNIPLVDLAIEFDRHNDLFDDPLIDPIHFNARGHNLAARLIKEQLSAQLDSLLLSK